MTPVADHQRRSHGSPRYGRVHVRRETRTCRSALRLAQPHRTVVSAGTPQSRKSSWWLDRGIYLELPAAPPPCPRLRSDTRSFPTNRGDALVERVPTRDAVRSVAPAERSP